MSHLSLQFAKRAQFHPNVRYVIQEEFGDAVVLHCVTQQNRVTFHPATAGRVGFIGIEYRCNRGVGGRTYRTINVLDDTSFADTIVELLVEATSNA